MSEKIKSIEELKESDVMLVEVELMLTASELQTYAQYCKDNKIKFNDWIRILANDALDG